MTASWGEVAESRRDITLYESWSTLAWGTFIPFSLPFIYSLLHLFTQQIFTECPRSKAPVAGAQSINSGVKSVSYTHLTLPTSLRV